MTELLNLSEAQSGHSTKEPHFSCVDPGSSSFSQDPNLVTADEGWNTDGPVNTWDQHPQIPEPFCLGHRLSSDLEGASHLCLAEIAIFSQPDSLILSQSSQTELL